MMRSLGWLVAGTGLAWLLLTSAVEALGVPEARLIGGVAALLCLLPSAGTMFWAKRSLSGQPEQQLIAVLGGTMLRMIVVAAGAMALYVTVEGLGDPTFLYWVIAFYLITLTLEVVLLVRGTPADDARKS